MKAIQITIEVTVNQLPEVVWEHYTQSQHIVHWNFASDDWHCPKAENNPFVGGTYFSRMEAKDGSFGFDFKAVYDEVIPNEKLLIISEFPLFKDLHFSN
jgi:uncharacterized protein YndB with AHSA1/START domain